MLDITRHPILDIPTTETVYFEYEGKKVPARRGFTIAAALHQAGFPVHSHSLKNRSRSLECGIGKCGACEMLVDGQIKRICVTNVDGVKKVSEIPADYAPQPLARTQSAPVQVYRTDVAIIGAGPAGLAARQELLRHNVPNIVIDNNAKTGGQFPMQTHQFFFFEKEQVYGGRRGFEIADALAGGDNSGIFLNCTVWDILHGGRVAVKNVQTEEIFYIDAEYLIVATGAVPFMPPFRNDDMPGVYTAAVIQKMMNVELTLLGKNILTVGAGNIGYLTSYQLIQAGASVKAIIEAQDAEGGFPVQANRIKRLGVPIILSHVLVEAIPNQNKDGIAGAVIAECKNFEPVPGTEKVIYGIDAINICTGLVSDDQLFTKGCEVFGRNCCGAGDALRIGEGTSAVLRGRQAAFEILDSMDIPYDYDQYLNVSKEYIDSQQHPLPVLTEPLKPAGQRNEKPFVLIDCLYGFACNPCVFACPFGAITKSSTSSVPRIDYEKCTGCMQCVSKCPGLAIFGYDLKKNLLFLPFEYDVRENTEVELVDNNGAVIGSGLIEKIRLKENKTNVAVVRTQDIRGQYLLRARGFVPKDRYPEKPAFEHYDKSIVSESYICHCDDVRLAEILDVIGSRRFISVDEVKHTTRLGMGACRGKRCFPRLKQILRPMGISLVGTPTPRAPLSSQVALGELYPNPLHDRIISGITVKSHHVMKVKAFVAGGGIAGSALFRYLAQAGLNPVLVNCDRGASWRNIAGGRPSFSLPELSEIAVANHEIFKELQKIRDINYMPSEYVTFAHDEQMYRALKASVAWSDSFMIEPKDFRKMISPLINPDLNIYLSALITRDCWQATPGKVIDLLRTIGIENGGMVLEDCRLIDVEKKNGSYRVLVRTHDREYAEFQAEHFVNALGPQSGAFAERLGLNTGLYTVKHQAFITRRLPMLGKAGAPLPMLIDRRVYKGFSAVYGQQLGETGQIIGCGSPAVEALEAGKDLKTNSRQFLEVASEIFCNWIPQLSSVGFQAVWAGFYVEPRMIIDPQNGLFVGLRGQGFMLSQYLAKMYVDKLLGRPVPAYFDRLALAGNGLAEQSFK